MLCFSSKSCCFFAVNLDFLFFFAIIGDVLYLCIFQLKFNKCSKMKFNRNVQMTKFSILSEAHAKTKCALHVQKRFTNVRAYTNTNIFSLNKTTVHTCHKQAYDMLRVIVPSNAHLRSITEQMCNGWNKYLHSHDQSTT